MKTTRAFTILEMSIVMSIIAVLISSGLTVVTSKLNSERIKITTERMTLIRGSLIRYVKQFNRIPCPAAATAAVDSTNFGVGVGTDSASPGSCPVGTEITPAGVSNVYIGAVPTATLGIEPIFMLDGWNRKITYAVDRDLTFTGDPSSGYLNPNELGNIQFQDELGNNIMGVGSDPLDVDAAVIFISHGENGHGAWRMKGTNTFSVVTPGTIELENIPIGANTLFKTSASNTTRTTNHFDDTLSAIGKWQFNE